MATANGLVSAGFDVTVLTADRETFLRYTGADPSLEPLVDPSIDVVRVPFEWPLREWDIRRWSRERAGAPKAWERRHLESTMRLFPEPNYGHWRPALEEAAREVHTGRPVDVALATANPNVDFLGASVLHREHGVPYVLDHRDAWTLNQFSGERAHAEDSPQARWEKSLFASAEAIWFVNDAIREWHAKAYPESADRMRVVMNGWDPELMQAPPIADGGKQLSFGYIGTLTDKVPLEEFLNGWALARSAGQLDGCRAQLFGHLGFFAAADPRMAALIGDFAGSGVTYEGPVPKVDIADAYAGIDVLLMLLGGGRFVTSGKVFEYVATGRPIVSVHPMDSGCIEVLRDYPLWFPATSLDPRSIAEALSAAAAVARQPDPEARRACLAHADRYSRANQLRPALTEMRSFVTGVGA